MWTKSIRSSVVGATMVVVMTSGFLGGSLAGAARAGGDTTAVAINTKDGFDLFKLAFQIKRTMQDTVDNTNAAVAYASCSECQTVAIAFQIVLVMSDASTVTPTNLAIAINEECSACETLASAYQFVLSGDGHVRFTPEGNRALAEIKKELRDLRTSDLPIEEVQARLDEIKEQLVDVLETQLVPTGPAAGAPAEETDTSTPEPADPTEPTATPTATPTDDAEPTPSEPSETAEPSASPQDDGVDGSAPTESPEPSGGG